MSKNRKRKSKKRRHSSGEEVHRKRGHAFECLNPDCGNVYSGYEWRMLPVEHVDRARGHDVVRWPVDECPACGSLYFEWLSYGISPDDVYLRRELRTHFPLYGSLRKKSVD